MRIREAKKGIRNDRRLLLHCRPAAALRPQHGQEQRQGQGCGSAAEAGGAEDEDQFDALMTMLKFGE